MKKEKPVRDLNLLAPPYVHKRFSDFMIEAAFHGDAGLRVSNKDTADQVNQRINESIVTIQDQHERVNFHDHCTCDELDEDVGACDFCQAEDYEPPTNPESQRLESLLRAEAPSFVPELYRFKRIDDSSPHFMQAMKAAMSEMRFYDDKTFDSPDKRTADFVGACANKIAAVKAQWPNSQLNLRWHVGRQFKTWWFSQAITTSISTDPEEVAKPVKTFTFLGLTVLVDALAPDYFCELMCEIEDSQLIER